MHIKQMQTYAEAVSQTYARNCDIRRDDDWYFLKLQEETGELVQAWLRMTGRGRQKNDTRDAIRAQMENELADCFAQILLIAERYEVDLEQAMKNKWFQYLPAHMRAAAKAETEVPNA